MLSGLRGVSLFVAAADTVLNKSYHGGPTNVMLWQRYTGSPGHFGLTGVLVFAALVGAAVLALAQSRRRRGNQGRHREPSAPQRQQWPEGVAQRDEEAGRAPGSRRQSLAKEIAVLDAAYGAGRITAEEYERLRPVLKRRLMELMSNAKGGEAR